MGKERRDHAAPKVVGRTTRFGGRKKRSCGSEVKKRPCGSEVRKRPLGSKVVGGGGPQGFGEGEKKRPRGSEVNGGTTRF